MSARPWRPHQRIRASRVKGQVRSSGRVLKPHAPQPRLLREAVYGKTQAVHEPAGLNRTARLAGRTVPRQVRVQDRPKEEWTEIPVPALVDEETFERVQQRLEDNKRFASRNSKVPSLLQGMAACSSCGYGYYRTSTTTSAGKKISYYRVPRLRRLPLPGRTGSAGTSPSAPTTSTAPSGTTLSASWPTPPLSAPRSPSESSRPAPPTPSSRNAAGSSRPSPRPRDPSPR